MKLRLQLTRHNNASALQRPELCAYGYLIQIRKPLRKNALKQRVNAPDGELPYELHLVCGPEVLVAQRFVVSMIAKLAAGELAMCWT